MREIGGYLELERFFGSHFHKNALALNSGRGCLLYLIRARQIAKLFLPRYLCGDVHRLCASADVAIEYYNIGADFTPLFDGRLLQCEYLYVVNYYGAIGNAKLCELRDRYRNVVVDSVQAFFEKPVEGMDTLYSCRKFFGVPDGGYLYTDARLNDTLDVDCSGGRLGHLVGRMEHNATNYYATFKSNDDSLKGEGVKVMSLLTKNLLCAVDYAQVEKRRKLNYAVLDAMLKHKNALHIQPQTGPFAYPFYCSNGMDVRKHLAGLGIYVPLLWPDVVNKMPSNTIEYDYATNILPLPIDQRYDEADMKIVLMGLEEAMRGSKA